MSPAGNGCIDMFTEACCLYGSNKYAVILDVVYSIQDRSIVIPVMNILELMRVLPRKPTRSPADVVRIEIFFDSIDLNRSVENITTTSDERFSH